MMQTHSPSTRLNPVPATAALVANLDRVRAEFNEMPGLCLTLPQAVRFWALDADACRSLLDHLVHEGFLVRGRRGYRRAR
jgi:hypothetical protein